MKAIVFDFDGTIADTVPAITDGVNLALSALGLPTHTETDVLRFINHGARELIRHALPEPLQIDESFVNHALSVYHKAYGSVYLHTRAPYAGIGELISDLHRSCRVGVLSNKQDEYVKNLVRQVLPAGSVDATVGVENGKPTKPDPYLARKLAAALGVEPADGLMVGDSDVDIATARNAGMAHIGVAWGYRSAEFLRAAGAVRIAATPAELAALIAELRA